jgi:hypothetical protein
MTHPLGGEDFFMLEAGEYLGRLSSLANSTGVPNSEEIVRQALRGSVNGRPEPMTGRTALIAPPRAGTAD